MPSSTSLRYINSFSWSWVMHFLPCIFFQLTSDCTTYYTWNSTVRASLVAQMVKNLPVMQVDPGSMPGSGRSPGEENGNPLQYSCLENSIRGAWQATVHGVAKRLTLSFSLSLCAVPEWGVGKRGPHWALFNWQELAAAHFCILCLSVQLVLSPARNASVCQLWLWTLSSLRMLPSGCTEREAGVLVFTVACRARPSVRPNLSLDPLEKYCFTHC